MFNVIAPNDYPDFLKWMPSEEGILHYDTQKDQADALIEKAELIFTLDFNALFRAGEMETALKAAKATYIMIDHHQQPHDYARFVYSDVSISSTL